MTSHIYNTSCRNSENSREEHHHNFNINNAIGSHHENGTNSVGDVNSDEESVEDENNNSDSLSSNNFPQECTTNTSDAYAEDDSYKSEVPVTATSSFNPSLLHSSDVSSSSNVIMSDSSSMVTGIQEKRVGF